ncbi:MAG: hypothetical protein IJG97_01540 [Bacilli bacterium]|nr:hypothetical protein [Bacilli bacterium]
MDNENKELDVNKEKREEYEKLMQDSSTQLEGYYDKKNPFVILLLLILGSIIILGVIYYVVAYFRL